MEFEMNETVFAFLVILLLVIASLADVVPFMDVLPVIILLTSIILGIPLGLISSEGLILTASAYMLGGAVIGVFVIGEIFAVEAFKYYVLFVAGGGFIGAPIGYAKKLAGIRQSSQS